MQRSGVISVWIFSIITIIMATFFLSNNNAIYCNIHISLPEILTRAKSIKSFFPKQCQVMSDL